MKSDERKNLPAYNCSLVAADGTVFLQSTQNEKKLLKYAIKHFLGT
jgi:hypothetical protein